MTVPVAKKLIAQEGVSFEALYDPGTLMLTDELQDITVSYGDLMYLGSPGVRLLLNYKEVKFKGYLREFRPSGMVEGEPLATCEIEIV